MSKNKIEYKKPSKTGGFGGHGRHVGEKPKNTKKTLKRLLKLIGQEKLLIAVSIITTLVGVTINTIAPAYLGGAITKHLERDLNIQMFVNKMIVLVFLYIAAYIVNSLAGVAINYMGNKVLLKLRTIFFHKVQQLSISYFEKKGIGDLISRLTNDIETIQGFLTNGLIQLVTGVFSIIFILVAMFSLNITLTFSILITFPVMVLTIIVIGKQIRKAAKKNQEKVGKLSTVIEESVSGMKIIKSFHREDDEIHKFDKINTEARQAATKMETTSFLMFPIMNFINTFAMVLVIGIGGIMVINNPDIYSIGLLTSFIVYSRKFFEPVRQISQVYSSLQSALAGSERIFELLDSEDEIKISKNPIKVEKINGKVEFKNVTFAYEAGKTVLNDISFTAKVGENIAIVGPTGAGKTTIINLLSRFYDISKGNILVDDKVIKDLELEGYRRQLGIVLQEPFFFATTIRENIKYGNPDASDNNIIEAAKIANAHHFISRLPNGYDTELLERAQNLSHGERQLLAIARTILANPSILILDEATSNIDSLTEMHIQEAMQNLMKGRTSFIIAHRLSTIKNADKIMVVYDHKIIEQGTHSQLIEQKGYYHNLINS